MKTRQDLLQRWRSGLEANAAQTDENSRFHWIHRVYVRIYRFLISRYGSGDWRADSADGGREDEVEFATSAMPFVDNTADVTGLEPKSNEQIRRKLAAIHEANDHQPPRGSATRLTVQQYVAVASSKNHKTVDRIWKTLSAHGFHARIVNRTTDYVIEVRHGDFDEALNVLRHGEWRTPPKRMRSFRLVRTPGRSLSGGERFLALVGLTLGGFACFAIVAIIVRDAAGYAPSESLLLIGILVVMGLFCSLFPRFGR